MSRSRSHSHSHSHSRRLLYSWPWHRSVSLAISLLGAFVNFAFAVQLLSAWRSLKWEKETEWEGVENPWRRDGVQLVWGLLSAYFAAAASVCVVGFIGIVKSIPSYVRFYRDYTIADFTFTSLFTLLAAYAAFTAPSLRALLCEELARQPDLMREMEAGVGLSLSLENCEGWVERAVLAGAAGMVVVIVGRLHCLLALCGYYSHMRAAPSPAGLPIHMGGLGKSATPVHQHQHIYLLPAQTDEAVVYAPVPLSSLSPQQANTLSRAWISRPAPGSSEHPHSHSGRRHSHSHSHSHRRHGSREASGHHRGGSVTGRICLPVAPEEGLLPAYEESVKA